MKEIEEIVGFSLKEKGLLLLTFPKIWWKFLYHQAQSYQGLQVQRQPKKEFVLFPKGWKKKQKI